MLGFFLELRLEQATVWLAYGREVRKPATEPDGLSNLKFFSKKI